MLPQPIRLTYKPLLPQSVRYTYKPPLPFWLKAAKSRGDPIGATPARGKAFEPGIAGVVSRPSVVVQAL